MKNWFKKTNRPGSKDGNAAALQALIDRVGQMPTEKASCNLAEFRDDLISRLLEVQKGLLKESCSENEPSTFSVAKIESATQAAFDQVDQIPEGSVAGLNLADVKCALKKALIAVRDRTAALQDILNVFKAVRDEIFKPVIKETRHANLLAISGLVIAVIALIVPFALMLRSAPAQTVSAQSGVTQAASGTTSLAAEDILSSVGEGPEHPAYGKIRSYVNELEGIVSSGNMDGARIARVRGMIISELKEMQKGGSNDPKTLAVATYGLVLCAAASNRWDEVSTLTAAWTDKNTNFAMEYGIPIRAYEAESLFRGGLTIAAQDKYEHLRNEGANTGETSFLSPIDFQPTAGSEFAASRLEDLKFRQEIATRAVWVFDRDGVSGTKIVKTLMRQGLNGAVAKGIWPGKPYHALYVYCKQPLNHQASEKLKALIAGIPAGQKHLIVQYVGFSGDKTVKDEFAANPTVDLIIIFPSMPKGVTAA